MLTIQRHIQNLSTTFKLNSNSNHCNQCCISIAINMCYVTFIISFQDFTLGTIIISSVIILLFTYNLLVFLFSNLLKIEK